MGFPLPGAGPRPHGPGRGYRDLPGNNGDLSLPTWDWRIYEGDLVLILDGIRDPGNAGTLLRSAAAAGVTVLAVSGTVDLSSPKVVRASMGGIFRVPWVANLAASELLQWVEAEDTA